MGVVTIVLFVVGMALGINASVDTKQEVKPKTEEVSHPLPF